MCVCVCMAGGPAVYILIYILSCHFGFVINLPAEYIVSVLLCMQAYVCVCERNFS